MNLDRSLEQASAVRGAKRAARLYNDIEYELALGEPDDRLETAGERALALLEGRFPDVQDAARQIEEPPNLSRRAGDALQWVGHGARQSRLEEGAQPRRPWNRLYEDIYAHPVRAVAMVVLFIIVVVKLWVYVALGMIAIAALRKYRASPR